MVMSKREMELLRLAGRAAHKLALQYNIGGFPMDQRRSEFDDLVEISEELRDWHRRELLGVTAEEFYAMPENERRLAAVKAEYGNRI